MWKLSGTMVGRGRGLSAVAAGAGFILFVTVKARRVLGSNSMVRAPFSVGMLSSTVN